MTHARNIVLACAMGIALPAAVEAQALKDRFWFEASAFKPDIDTTVRVSSAQGAVGTQINLEQDLNFADRQTLPAFFAGARFGARWAVTGEYYRLDRDGSAGVERDIIFDEVTFPAGVTVSSGMDTSIYRASLAYSFIHNDRAEVGVAVGAHVTQFDIQLSGEGYIGATAIQTQVRQRDALAPLPTLGLYGAYQVTPRLTLGGRADYMSLDVGEYDGQVTNLQATATYRLMRNISVGAAYRYVDYDLGIDKDRWSGELLYQFSGPSIFLQAAF